MKNKSKQKYYDNNTEFQKQSALKSKRKNNQICKEEKYRRLILQGGCACCGYMGEIIEFDFHHPPDVIKIANIGDMIGRRGLKVIFEEMDKCILVCNNKRLDGKKGCHEKIHYENHLN